MSAFQNQLGGSAIDPGAPTAERAPIAFIDYMRGLAPLLVLWAHLSGFWLYAHHQTWRPYAFFYFHFTQPLGLYEDGGRLGVVLFFLVSGYIVTHASARESVAQFGLKRVFRLGPALWVSVLVVFAARHVAHIAGVGAPSGTGGGSLWSYVRGTLLLDQVSGPVVNGVTWTLVVEVVFYVLTAMFMRMTRTRPVTATLLMLLATVATALLLDRFTATQELALFVAFVGFLLFGRALYLGHHGMISSGRTSLLALVVVIATVGTWELCSPGSMSDANGPQSTYVTGVLLFMVFMYAAPRHVPWPLRRVSEISYSLYLLHIPVGMLTIDLVLHAGAPFAVAFLAAVASSLLAATISHRLVERPAQRLVRTLLANRSAARRALAGRTTVLAPPAVLPQPVE